MAAADWTSEMDDPPNVVLRGGPFDGATVRVTTYNAVIERRGGGMRHRYRPTTDVDDEYPTLLIFVYAGSVE
jgi:hypothetical protein